ncbi:unnamed protein product [Didymodactylos carnosus]|uniref:Uncharacterized protein n=1 Tax=Didymodactylos carnosus TaxID=1234261 RepID=A0A813P066_9BILA|nr:unnamed protein product [Didymodactylos carnosus]CAF1187594.1 unnamed protein product [Didymodactylos carnosus]CAF3524146.1 unnamed protein product [Didymodactylos carnosus]CAF3998624.1 unnamed protein product [Didymodactylos carnosus]
MNETELVDKPKKSVKMVNSLFNRSIDHYNYGLQTKNNIRGISNLNEQQTRNETQQQPNSNHQMQKNAQKLSFNSTSSGSMCSDKSTSNLDTTKQEPFTHIASGNKTSSQYAAKLVSTLLKVRKTQTTSPEESARQQIRSSQETKSISENVSFNLKERRVRLIKPMSKNSILDTTKRTRSSTVISGAEYLSRQSNVQIPLAIEVEKIKRNIFTKCPITEKR